MNKIQEVPITTAIDKMIEKISSHFVELDADVYRQVMDNTKTMKPVEKELIHKILVTAMGAIHVNCAARAIAVEQLHLTDQDAASLVQALHDAISQWIAKVAEDMGDKS